ncbi:MAG TPA: GlsB/YeaQ/YmgE family stress response membrane protein [Ktedonobacterales bacterium]
MTGTVLAWVVVGGVGGWLASVLVRGGGLGILGDVVLGVIGGVIGGIVMTSLGGHGITGLNVWSLLVAFMGSVILLLLMRLLGASTRGA